MILMLKNNFTNYLPFFVIMVVLLVGCQPNEDDLQPASYPTNGDVFIDNFSSGLNYAAFGGSVPTAFQVDKSVTYNQSSAAMRFDVPNANDPNGAYAGGTFFTSMGRNLTDFDALTFWAKASQSATIDVVGFGNDLGINKYQASLSGVQLSTVWKKYIIPIPDASKLTAEKGMFFISEGPENGNGYSFWVDEVQFEKLGTLAHQNASIFNGATTSISSFNGVSHLVQGLNISFNLPNGINQAVNVTPYYFNFISSVPAVASVDETGMVQVLSQGSTVISALVGTTVVQGSLTINSGGNFVHAPTPMPNQENVISLFSDHYANIPVDYYNGYWAPYQTTQSSDFTVDNDHVLNYTQFNFVGIQSSSPTVNASSMSHLHAHIFIPNSLNAGAVFKVQVVDFGSDGVYGGGNDTNHTTTFTAPILQGQQWITLTIPFSSMSGLNSRNHLGQIIFEGVNIPNFYADNVFFYNDGSIIPTVPTVAAPIPTATNVISIFSDTYTNIAGVNFNPNWGQATQTSVVNIAGNNTLKMVNLNYQGIEFGSTQDVSSKTNLHLDYYTATSTSLKIFLISPGPVETAFILNVPSMGGWNSMNIPLSAFAPVNMSQVFQIKFEGNGEVYVDNIFFH